MGRKGQVYGFAIVCTLAGAGLVGFCILMRNSKELGSVGFVSVIVCGLLSLAIGIALFYVARFERSMTLYSDRLVVAQLGKARVNNHSDVREFIAKPSLEGGCICTVHLKDSSKISLPFSYFRTDFVTQYERVLQDVQNGQI